MVGWPSRNIKSKEKSLDGSDLETLEGGEGGFEVPWGAWIVSGFAWYVKTDGGTTQLQTVPQTTVLRFPALLPLP